MAQMINTDVQVNNLTGSGHQLLLLPNVMLFFFCIMYLFKCNLGVEDGQSKSDCQIECTR